MAFLRVIPASQPRAATRAPPDTSHNTPGQPVVDFHVFAELAPELQDAIWEFSCYSTPAMIPMFIDAKTFKFQFDKLPAVPALLQATSGARAIGLRHFTLVKAERFDRTAPRPAQPTLLQQPQPLLQQAQALLPIPPQAPLLHIQNQANGLHALFWQNASGPLSQAIHQQGHPPVHTWMTNPYNVPHNPGPTPPYGPSMFAPLQLTLPGQAQGPYFSTLHLHNASPQYHSQTLGATQPHGALPLSQPALGPIWPAPSQLMQQQTPAQHGHQDHIPFQQGSQHHGASTYSMFGGGSQPTSTQSLAQQSIAQYGNHHHGASASSIIGGGVQPTPTQSLGNQNLTQHGPQQQSMFGGIQQSTFAYQSFTQSFPHLPNAFQTSNPSGLQLHGNNQSTAIAQTMNPATSTNIVSQFPSGGVQRSLLITKSDSEGPYFYINHGSDFFRLQVGNPTGYHYPAFRLAQFPQLPNSVSDEGRLIYLQELQRAYTVPSPFPANGRLPAFFDKIQHLVLNLELFPCHAPLRSYGFTSWLGRSVSRFCSIVIKSTLAKFPNIKNLDLQIAGDIQRREGDRMVLRHWRDASIREENGVTFGHAELGILEMEIRLWMMNEYMGKDGPEGPEVRIVVQVPHHYSQTRW